MSAGWAGQYAPAQQDVTVGDLSSLGGQALAKINKSGTKPLNGKLMAGNQVSELARCIAAFMWHSTKVHQIHQRSPSSVASSPGVALRLLGWCGTSGACVGAA
jgi:hypothetical protein